MAIKRTSKCQARVAKSRSRTGKETRLFKIVSYQTGPSRLTIEPFEKSTEVRRVRRETNPSIKMEKAILLFGARSRRGKPTKHPNTQRKVES